MSGKEEIQAPSNPYNVSVANKSEQNGSQDQAKSSLGRIAKNSNDYNARSRGSSASSLSSVYNSYSQDIQPKAGCVVLGKDGDTGQQYTTRFRIDSTSEKHAAEERFVLEDCFLCVKKDKHQSVCQCFTSMIMSEAFLLTAHLVALALGVAKSSISRENIDKDIELIHSVVEIVMVSFVLFARCMLVRNSYKDLKHYRKHSQHVDISESHSTVGKQIRTSMYVFIAICILFDILVIVVSALFYFVLHLGWTTLVNNAVLIVATVLSNLILKKTVKLKAVTIEDEHKVVLYEASLLLKEGDHDMTEVQRKCYNRKVMNYLKSLMDTDTFKQPSHIELIDKGGPKWDTITTVQVMSSV